MTRYPWHERFWQRWAAMRQRPAQGYLVTGPAGTGVTGVCREMARSLLCPEAGCGQCTACAQFEAGTHADLRIVEPEAPRRPVRVDQIRTLVDWVVESAHASAGFKVVWLPQAEAMNTSSANALLKALEEPPPNVVFILQAPGVDAVLPTLRSRCQLIRLPQPTRAEGLQWLRKQFPDLPEDRLEAALDKQFDAPIAARDWLSDDGWSRYTRWREQMTALSRGQQDLVSVARDWADWDNPAEPLRFLLAWSLKRPVSERNNRLQTALQHALAMLAHSSINVQLVLEQVLVEHLYGEKR
ncbi:DNA polymerase III subunit delta' [Sulfurivirga sp.]|uniref:DNA polymerase III subunit delta' n=1 Tax=Sulfurivirga sp. TaxID=2614236 RepID=UPI0025D2F7E9|nr:DNA polymerase III subunit delta' [Sulfurivirga sp.]